MHGRTSDKVGDSTPDARGKFVDHSMILTESSIPEVIVMRHAPERDASGGVLGTLSSEIALRMICL